MPEPRVARLLVAAEAAYIAGLIDGEGTITLSRRHKHDNRQLMVTISSTERPLLEFVLEQTQVGKITAKRTYQAHHRPNYTYAVGNRQALQLLKQVQTYLRSYKRRRCELALEKYLRWTPRNGKYTDDLLADRTKFEIQFLAIKPS